MGDDDDLDEEATDVEPVGGGDIDDFPDDVGNGDIGEPDAEGGGVAPANTEDDDPFEGLSLTDAEIEAMPISEA